MINLVDVKHLGRTAYAIPIVYSKAYSGSEKIVFLEKDIFTVKVPLSGNETENVTEKRQNNIIDEITLNNKSSIDQLAERLKVTRRTIIRDLEILKKQNIIKRTGTAKGGYWQVIE